MDLDLTGRHALVCGASEGIGRATAQELALLGADVTVLSRREYALRAVVDALPRTGGQRHGLLAADLADTDGLRAAIEALAGGHPVHALVNNTAGPAGGPVQAAEDTAFLDTFRRHLLANHALVLAVLPGMLERNAGGILISGSAAGNSPIPNNATYAASKAFANTFSESLRGELKGAGVHVTVLAPGPVRTDLPDESEQSLVERLIPDFLWISTEYTAKLSLDGLEKNKMRVVPGVTSKAMSMASGYAPRAIVTPIVGAVYKKLGGG